MTIVTAVEDARRDRWIVSEGANLANAFDDELHVIHVRNREDLEESATTGAADQRSPRDVARDTAASIASNGAEEFTPVGRIGSPATEIREYVEEVDARYLVVGGRKRSPIGKALFGSVTQSLLLNVDQPVVTVRTESAE